MRTTSSAIVVLAAALYAGGCPGCVKDSEAVASPRASAASASSLTSASPPREAETTNDLKGPFDVEARRRAMGASIPDPPSSPRVPPVRDLMGVSFYVDKSHSVADPALKKQNEEAVRPVRTFVATFTALADGWMRGSPPNPAYATLALEELFAWASAGALLGEVNKQGGYERKWTLGSLAIAFLKIRAAPGLDPAKLAATRDWLSKVARSVMPPYDDLSNSASRNNHAYWAGLAIAASGVAANDRALFDWGISRARMGISDIRADGTLPLEMERGTLALHYHAFALPPLAMLAEIGAANGLHLYDENDGALRRLADRVIRGIQESVELREACRGSADVPPRDTSEAVVLRMGGSLLRALSRRSTSAMAHPRIKAARGPAPGGRSDPRVRRHAAAPGAQVGRPFVLKRSGGSNDAICNDAVLGCRYSRLCGLFWRSAYTGHGPAGRHEQSGGGGRRAVE